MTRPILRVCLVSTGSPLARGGNAVHLGRLAEAFSTTCRVNVVARFASKTPRGVDYAAKDRPGRYELDSGALSVIAPAGGWAPVLRALPRLMRRSGGCQLAACTFSRAFRRPLDDAIPRDVDIVHVIGTGWELLGFAALAIARRREAAFTISPTLHPGIWGDSVLDAALYKAADGVIALTSAEAAHLRRLGVPSEGIAVSGLGPSSPIGGDGQRFRHTYAVGDRPMILFVGRRQRYKGYHALCGAMAETAERFPDALLVVVGAETEPLFPTVPPKRFLDLGECSDETKADALAACDVFCMPSEGESFGMAYVEAWAYGKPVVAGPAPAAREIVAASGGGVCVENDPASIADGLKRLLGDPALRQRLGTEGHRYQQCEFQWDVVATRHLQYAFRRALSARRRPQLAGRFLPVNTPFASSSAGDGDPRRRSTGSTDFRMPGICSPGTTDSGLSAQIRRSTSGTPLTFSQPARRRSGGCSPACRRFRSRLTPGPRPWTSAVVQADSTQALASRFAVAHGVDVSREMLTLARKLAAAGGADCRFHQRRRRQPISLWRQDFRVHLLQHRASAHASGTHGGISPGVWPSLGAWRGPRISGTRRLDFRAHASIG